MIGASLTTTPRVAAIGTPLLAIRGVETFQIVGILPQSDNVRRCIAECQRAGWKADCGLTFLITEGSIL